jgi:hypothetical protein
MVDIRTDNTPKHSPEDEKASVRRASQNARRHGLATSVPHDETLAIYRELLDNPKRTGASFVTEEIDRLLWVYAETEAQVARALRAERAHIFGRMPGTDLPSHSEGEGAEKDPMVLSVRALKEIVLSDSSGDIETLAEKVREKMFQGHADKLRRYRREAETRRRKALRTYLRAVRAEQKGDEDV